MINKLFYSYFSKIMSFSKHEIVNKFVTSYKFFFGFLLRPNFDNIWHKLLVLNHTNLFVFLKSLISFFKEWPVLWSFSPVDIFSLFSNVIKKIKMFYYNFLKNSEFGFGLVLEWFDYLFYIFFNEMLETCTNE